MRSPISTALLAMLCLASAARAQEKLTLPWQHWRTLETRHFVVHYARENEAWTRAVASGLDAEYAAVSALVGSAPERKVTVIVADPFGQSNGFAIPLLEAPLVFFFPVPPDPTFGAEFDPGWGELLGVHEFAHLAHLTRPSRNPTVRFITSLVPLRVSPIAASSPRWVTEGYATYVEGKITGGGRPHSTARAAVLRQWALEGQLPTYGELDASSRFMGGSMAYLAGSAFLEWLAVRGGDSSLVHLWRRMTARTTRDFDEAFAGVYGAPADVLYGRFVAELSAGALDVERSLGAQDAFDTRDSAGVRIVERLAWSTGAPAISRNGALLAHVVAHRDEPRRVVVWTAAPDTAALRRERAQRALAQRLDPEDVPAVRWRPPPLRRIATLGAHAGSPFGEPRFLSDGQHLLLTRLAGRGDGYVRSDLYVWNFRTGALRRVTHGAGIRHADPAPDGRSAVADRCAGGICDVVRVDLASGRIAVLARGAPDVVYSRPRVSPDGKQIVVAVQRGGVWRVELLDARGGGAMAIGPPDDVPRYAPAFTRDGRAVVVTSEAGGIANLERIDLATGETRALTRVTGAALAPEPAPDGSVYFLRLHSRGYDVARVIPDSVGELPPVETSASEAPVISAPPAYDSLPQSSVPPSRDYGVGPRRAILLPSGAWTAEGKRIGAMLAGTDPVGRLTWMLQGQYGDRGTWRGVAAAGAWRGTRPLIGAEAFYVEDHPSAQHGGHRAPRALDIAYGGGTAWTSLDVDYLSHSHVLDVGASIGSLASHALQRGTRKLAFARLRNAWLQTPGNWRLSEKIDLDGATGATGGAGWTRGIASMTLAIGHGDFVLQGDGSYGRIDRVGLPFERFVLGGSAPPLFDAALLGQRLAMPALPVGVAGGRQAVTYRISLPQPVWRPYFWAGSAGTGLGTWHRVVGIEAEVATGGIWIVKLPGARVLGGIGYSLDAPVRHQTRGYFSITYRP